MKSTSEIIREVWSKTQPSGMILIVVIVAAVVLSWLMSGSSRDGQPARSRPYVTASRRVLRVCCPDSKQILYRTDLLQIADAYEIKVNERPSIDEILRLNAGCRTSPQEEALNCHSPGCLPQQGDGSCQTGVFLVPIR